MTRKHILSIIVIGIFGIVVFLALWAYRDYQTQTKVYQYVENANIVTSAPDGSSFMQAVQPLPDEIKTKEGNLFPHVLKYRSLLAEEYHMDPFNPTRPIELRYGYVEHTISLPQSDPIPHEGPTWFSYSPGPSNFPPEIITSTSGEFQTYKFKSTPYAITNGLNSAGYLYSDSNGFRTVLPHTPYKKFTIFLDKLGID